MSKEIPDKTQIVVVGGGIAGCSVAYHLAQLNLSDIILLERKTLTSGTTWHSAGLLAQLRANRTQTQLARYSLELYERLEAETGQGTGMRRNGTLMLARRSARWTELKRRYCVSRSYGLESHLLSPGEVGDLWELLEIGDLKGGLYIPGDGQIDPTGVTLALAKGARRGGVQIFENNAVTGIRLEKGRAVGVETTGGNISCELVVNCAGIWAREFGRMAGVTIPLLAVEHMYMITEPMPDLRPGIPSLRDYDGLTYFKEDAGKLIVGGTEREARPWGVDKIPHDFEFTLLDEDWEQFEELAASARHRVPQLNDIGIRRLLNGPESFTPDGQYILGRCLEVDNIYVCAGFNSSGISASGGAGRALAEWIVEGVPTMDLMDVDVRRFRDFHGTKNYLQDRTRETVSTAFTIHWPFLQPETARGLRLSALHGVLSERNACFGEMAGWERPNWFAPDGIRPQYEYSFGRQNWFQYSADEHRAVRERVGLADISSFTKFRILGKDALTFLQLLCTKDIDCPRGSVVYTLMLNQKGGIECDLTVTRIAEQNFLLFCGAGAYGHVLGWMRSHINPDWDVSICDFTSSEGGIAVMGPESRNLLSRLSSADFSNEAFPFLTAQEIDISCAICRASRVSMTGELGWELNISTEFMPIVYADLLKAGGDLGVQDVGYHALDSLRIERGYRHFGHDITAFDTPLEAGLGFTVDLKKTVPFIGRDTVIKQKEEGLERRIVMFTLQDAEPLLYHHEPVWRDSTRVGEITSAAYGHTVGRAVGFGYVQSVGEVTDDFIKSGEYEIEIATRRVPADVSLLPPYDPGGLRVRM